MCFSTVISEYIQVILQAHKPPVLLSHKRTRSVPLQTLLKGAKRSRCCAEGQRSGGSMHDSSQCTARVCHPWPPAHRWARGRSLGWPGTCSDDNGAESVGAWELLQHLDFSPSFPDIEEPVSLGRKVMEKTCGRPLIILLGGLGFESWVCHLVVMSSWGSYLTFRSSFLISKMGINGSQFCCENYIRQ